MIARPADRPTALGTDRAAYRRWLERLVSTDTVSPLAEPQLAQVEQLLGELGCRRVENALFVRGNPEARVWLYAHVDTKPPVPIDRWVVDPFAVTEREGRWHGLGISDSKFQLLNALTVQDPERHFLLIDGAEECQGTDAGELLRRRQPDVLVIVDGSVGRHDAYNGLSGQADGSLTLSTGRAPHHPGRETEAPSEGQPSLQRLVLTFLQQVETADFRFNVTGLSAPTTVRSLTLEETTVRFDIRFTKRQQEGVRTFLRARGCEVRQWMPPVEGLRSFAADERTSAGPAPFSSNLGIVDGIEPGLVVVVPGALPDNGNHQPNEFIRPPQIDAHLARLRRTLARLEEAP